MRNCGTGGRPVPASGTVQETRAVPACFRVQLLRIRRRSVFFPQPAPGRAEEAFPGGAFLPGTEALDFPFPLLFQLENFLNVVE